MTSNSSYGVLERNKTSDEYDVLVEEIFLNGFTTLHSGFAEDSLERFSVEFERARCSYFDEFKNYSLTLISEQDVIRVIPNYSSYFFEVLFNKHLHKLLKKILGKYYIVNQVNGLINRPVSNGGQGYSQLPFHRDLPFRHVVFSRPLAINALFAIDDFTVNNGATRVIPGSHKMEKFPSDSAVDRLQKKVTVSRGTFIVLDCMTYHAASENLTSRERRAINHVFTIPAMRQQLFLPSVFGEKFEFTESQRKILGYDLNEFRTHEDWFNSRAKGKRVVSN
jgi:hypothetical protein